MERSLVNEENDLDGPIAYSVDTEIIPVTIKLHEDLVNALSTVTEIEDCSSRSELVRQLLVIALNQYWMRRNVPNRQFSFNPLNGEQYLPGDKPDESLRVCPASGDIVEAIKGLAKAAVEVNPLKRYVTLK